MTAKEEIERRLRKPDIKKMAKELYSKDFESLTDDEYTNILKIADVYGEKYKRFYKLKENVDIRTLTSNISVLDYTPNYNNHKNLTVIGQTKSNNSFTIYTEFYTSEEIFVPVNIEGKEYREKQNIFYRRIMVLEKKANIDFLIISIDPIGEGSNVYKKIEENLTELESCINIDINNFFDILDVDKAMHKLVGDGSIAPTKVVASDNTNKRIKSVTAQAKDNLKDDSLYDSCEKDEVELSNMRMKTKNETIELYGKTLLKIRTRAGKDTTDELTRSIIPVL